MDAYEIAFSGRVLRRGFWIYVWSVLAPDGRHLIYVGRTGDSSSPNAQSPFCRVGQHVNPKPKSKSNALTRNLRSVGVEPETCEFTFIAMGPILPEAEAMADHVRRRDLIAALERDVADWFKNRGYAVLGSHPRKGHVAEETWQSIEAELTARFSVTHH